MSAPENEDVCSLVDHRNQSGGDSCIDIGAGELSSLDHFDPLRTGSSDHFGISRVVAHQGLEETTLKCGLGGEHTDYSCLRGGGGRFHSGLHADYRDLLARLS